MIDLIPSPGIIAIKPTEVITGVIEAATEKESKKPKLGEVVAVGGPGHFDNGTIKPLIPYMKGDVVAYRAYGEEYFLFGEDTIVFVDARDILAKIRGVNNE